MSVVTLISVSCSPGEQGSPSSSPTVQAPASQQDWQVCASHDSPGDSTSGVFRVDGQIWAIQHAAPVSRLMSLGADGRWRSQLEVGLLPTDSYAFEDGAWVANGVGAATVYPADEEGPGFPHENSVMRISLRGSAAELDQTLEVPNPVAITMVGDDLWVLSFGPTKELLRITSAGEVLRRLPISGGGPIDLVSQGSQLWVMTQVAHDGGGGGSSVGRLGASESGSIERVVANDDLYTLVASDDRVWGLVRGRRGRLIGLWPKGLPDVEGLEFPQAAALGHGLVWVANEAPLIRAFDPDSGEALFALQTSDTARELVADKNGLIALTDSTVLEICRR